MEMADADQSAGTPPDAWQRFLRGHSDLLTRELAVRHPQFTAALWRLEHDSRVELERRSQQALLALRHKDERIAQLEQALSRSKEADKALVAAQPRAAELQAVVAEQREQIDVLLDELERVQAACATATQRPEDHQKAPEPQSIVDVTVQDAHTQTDAWQPPGSDNKDEAGRIPSALEGLAKELQALESRNLALEKELQRRLPVDQQAKAAVSEVGALQQDGHSQEQRERIENCLAVLQQAAHAVDLSCSCLQTPLAFSTFACNPATQSNRKDADPDSGSTVACVRLEHRLEMQAMRLEHIHESVYGWREATMKAIQQQQEYTAGRHVAIAAGSESSDNGRISSAMGTKGELNCAAALRGALQQIREHQERDLQTSDQDKAQVLQEVATALAEKPGGEKRAAKIVRNWAGWEASHLKEVRGLRRGFAEERLVAQQRRAALLKELDRATQCEMDLRAEVNALKKKLKRRNNRGAAEMSTPGTLIQESPSSERFQGPTAVVKGVKSALAYPQLLLRLASVEQELRDKNEQLHVADETIRALSCSPAALGSDSTTTDSSVTRLTLELRRAKQLNIDLSRRREQDLVNVAQYFAMEKAGLQLQTRLESERRRAAALQAAQSVNEQEIQDLRLEVEKLEMRTAIGTMDPSSVRRAMKSPDDLEVSLHFASRRLELLENDRKILRERLRRSQLELTLLRSQGETEGEGKQPQSEVGDLTQTFVSSVAEHHGACVDKLKAFEEAFDRKNKSLSSQAQSNDDVHARKGQAEEWSLLLRHYEALWMAFQVLYAFLGDLVPSLETGSQGENAYSSENAAVLAWFGCQGSQSSEAVTSSSSASTSLVGSSSRPCNDLELCKRDEKILLLQQMLVEKDEQLYGQRASTQHDGELDSAASTCPQAAVLRQDKERPFGEHRATEARDAAVQTTKNPLVKEGTLLAPPEPQEPSPRLAAQPREHEVTLINAPSGKNDGETMHGLEPSDTLRRELEQCREECAALKAQNGKLARRLRAACATNSQYSKEHRELRAQLSASASANTELVQHLTRCQQQPQRVTPLYSSEETLPSGTALQDSTMKGEKVRKTEIRGDGCDTKNDGCLGDATQAELDALKEQLASREQENLGMVQSLCAIKEKCSQMEKTHEHALRKKAVEHAESLESYMGAINERLSRVEEEKRQLGEENAELRVKAQQHEEECMRLEQSKARRCSRGTSIDQECAFLDSTEHARERETLEARVQDLELQLQQERKLCATMEHQQKLREQEKKEADNRIKRELHQAKERFSAQLQASREWRARLQREFALCQTAQREAQRESDKRLAFLASCVAECARAADTASTTRGAQAPTSKELYDAVMALARSPPAWTAEKHLWNKRELTFAPAFQQSSSNQDSLDDGKPDAEWSDIEGEHKTTDDDREQQWSAEMWWKLRATKLEACVRGATLQNETFEDTIHQLELRMEVVKKELSTRLARESLLVSKQTALKSELATVKDQAASLAESYQQVSDELEKRDGEAASRSDQAQRARVAVQRKTELLSQQKTKVATLQHELAEAVKKVEKLTTAGKHATALHYKAREQTQQLQQVRQELARSNSDNAQLSLHLEKVKERHASVLARLKATRAENTRLRAQTSELKSDQAEVDVSLTDKEDKSEYRRQSGAGTRVDALTEEVRALKRRVLQKQDVIVSYKAKVTELDEQLTRQRDTMVKFARANRSLQQTQRQQIQQEQSHASIAQSGLETLLESKQQQLDGLRASVYDSFEAFVYCRDAQSSTVSHEDCTSPSSSLTESLGSPPLDSEGDKLRVIRQWTDFSEHELEELELDGGRHNSGSKRRRNRDSETRSRQAAVAALRDMEDVLEASPHDCRVEICQLLECLCGLQGRSLSSIY